jgi:hypothetical protein
MPEYIDYRGYHLSIMRSGPRWYAAIHPRFPHQAKPCRHEEIASGATQAEAITAATRKVDWLLEISMRALKTGKIHPEEPPAT